MIKIAICDDEITAIQSLSDKIKSFMDHHHDAYSISKFMNGEALLFEISEKNAYFDVIFLDIKMDRTNGMDTARMIRSGNHTTTIIFVSAFTEFVFEAFDVNAANFLVKPINVQKLNKALENVAAAVRSSNNDFLVIQRFGEIKKIPLINIMYCEVVNHQVFIYEKGRVNEDSRKIDDLEKELNQDFFRCHRSYLVNLNYVVSYSDGIAHLASSERIPIATRRQQDFMKALLIHQRKGVR